MDIFSSKGIGDNKSKRSVEPIILHIFLKYFGVYFIPSIYSNYITMKLLGEDCLKNEF